MDLNLFCGRFFMACLYQLSILCAFMALKERTQLNCSSLFKLSHATLILYSWLELATTVILIVFIILIRNFPLLCLYDPVFPTKLLIQQYHNKGKNLLHLSVIFWFSLYCIYKYLEMDCQCDDSAKSSLQSLTISMIWILYKIAQLNDTDDSLNPENSRSLLLLSLRSCLK